MSSPQQQQQQQEQEAELELIIRLLKVTEQEDVTDEDNAALLIDRTMFHFMRLTTLRRNQRQSVSEAELLPALELADSLFLSPSLLRLVAALPSSEGDDGGGGGNVLSNVVCVMLDELLCFLDDTQSASVTQNDPPSFHVRRIKCASDLLLRLSSGLNSSSSNSSGESTQHHHPVSRAVFRQTLPGVASRCCHLLSKTFNGSSSAAATKLQRESCCEAIKLLRRQLVGCDFPSWLRAGDATAHRSGVSAFIRIANLLSVVVESFVRLVVFHVEQGGIPPVVAAADAASTSSASSVAAGWFLPSSSSSSSIDFNAAVSSLVVDALHGGMLNSDKIHFDAKRLSSEQVDAAKLAQSSLQLAALRWYCLASRWFQACPDNQQKHFESVAIIDSKFDQLCFEQQQSLRCVVLYDAAVSVMSSMQENDVGGSGDDAAAAALRSTRRDRLFRHLISGLSASIDAVDAMLGESSSYSSKNTPASAGGILANIAQENGAASSSSDSQQLTHFEKWLVAGTASPHHCAVNFLLIAARAASRELILPPAHCRQHEDGGGLESHLQHWLDAVVFPILSDPFEFRKHHAMALLVMAVLQNLLLSSSSSSSSSSSPPAVDALNSLMWGDTWPSLWDGVVVARFPRSLSEHWDKCTAAQRRFRVTLNGVMCKVVGVIGRGIAEQQQQLCSKSKKRKKNRLSDAGDRFLLLSVRELLNIASTEADVNSIARDSAMSTLRGIAASFGPLLCVGDEQQQQQQQQQDESKREQLHLLALLRHCIASVVDVCSRELRGSWGQNNDAEEESVFYERQRLLGNCRVLSAAALLCVQQQQKQQQKRKSTATSELLPSVTVIAEVCSSLLRDGVDRGALFSDPEIARSARSLLLRTALAVADFTRGAMHEQDARWLHAAADQRAANPRSVREGNIVRNLYKSGAVKRPPLPGQAAIMASDTEWMDTDDFSAFVDPGIAKLHELIIVILGCAVAALGAHYFASSSSSSPEMIKNRSRSQQHRDTSLLQLESGAADSDSSSPSRWNVVATSSQDSSPIPSISSSSSLVVSASASSSTSAAQQKLRQWTNTASIAERAMGVRLSVACLRSVATTTPASYFEPMAYTEEEQKNNNDDDDEAARTLDAVHPREDPAVAAMVTTAMKDPPVRVARGHWTSVFKLFHALQSLLLSSRDRSSGFRDIPSAVTFFHRFAAALRNVGSGEGVTTEAVAEGKRGSTRDRDSARIELRSCIDSLKRAQLLADESIAQVPDACVFLVSSAPVFLLYRTQTEVMPLLGLQWLTLCCAKEPEIWTALTTRTGGGDDQHHLAPRTLVGRTFRGGMMMLRDVCGLTSKSDVDDDKTQKSTLAESAAQDIHRIFKSLDQVLL